MLSLPQLVCTLEQAIELRELGVKQESVFSYFLDIKEEPILWSLTNLDFSMEENLKWMANRGRFKTEDGEYIDVDETAPTLEGVQEAGFTIEQFRTYYSAFTLAELGEMIDWFDVMDFKNLIKEEGGATSISDCWTYKCGNELVKGESETIARANLLIHQLKKK